MANRKPRKEIQDLIEELRSWLPNYDHRPDDYPTLLWRILAGSPGGDRAEDMGYEPFNLGWQEISQLGEVLTAIQDKRDVEDLVAGLIDDEEADGDFDSIDDALSEIEVQMKRNGFYPNIYYVNDHGNIDLLDAQGNTIKSRV